MLIDVIRSVCEGSKHFTDYSSFIVVILNFQKIQFIVPKMGYEFVDLGFHEYKQQRLYFWVFIYVIFILLCIMFIKNSIKSNYINSLYIN
jgi:hypothetical protein